MAIGKAILGQAIHVSDGTANQRRLEIIISSQIAYGESIAVVQANIDAAMKRNIEDAMVVEGRSGLKKLLQLSADVREIESIFVSYENDLVHAHCVMNLPVS